MAYPAMFINLTRREFVLGTVYSWHFEKLAQLAGWDRNDLLVNTIGAYSYHQLSNGHTWYGKYSEVYSDFVNMIEKTIGNERWIPLTRRKDILPDGKMLTKEYYHRDLDSYDLLTNDVRGRIRNFREMREIERQHAEYIAALSIEDALEALLRRSDMRDHLLARVSHNQVMLSRLPVEVRYNRQLWIEASKVSTAHVDNIEAHLQYLDNFFATRPHAEKCMRDANGQLPEESGRCLVNLTRKEAVDLPSDIDKATFSPWIYGGYWQEGDLYYIPKTSSTCPTYVCGEHIVKMISHGYLGTPWLFDIVRSLPREHTVKVLSLPSTRDTISISIQSH